MKESELTNEQRQAIIEKYLSFEDNRSLTDETLKELGFEKTKFPHIMKNKRLTAVKNNAKWLIYFTYEDETWKTVGKLKMLIEALKGEIK